MPGLGDLVVNLSADNKKLNAGLDAGKSGIKGFASSAVSLLNPVTAAFTAMAAGVVGVGAAVWGLQGRIATLAGVADKAAQTGLSGKFLQQLEYAADQSGVAAETLTGGIKKLTIAVGSGSKAFESLGLNLADLKKLTPERQFMAVADAISKLPTAAERAAAAVKVFGKSGVDMTNLFAGGLSDINKLMADAQALGIGVSDEGLAKAAAADDAIQRMKSSFSALIDQVAVGLAPTFAKIAGYITDWIPPLTQFLEKFNALDKQAKFVGDVFDASLDLATEHIKENWAEMLQWMIDETAISAKKIGESLERFTVHGQVKKMMKNVGQGVRNAFGVGREEDGKPKVNGVNAAEQRLADVLKQMDNGAQWGLPANVIGGDPIVEGGPQWGQPANVIGGDVPKEKRQTLTDRINKQNGGLVGAFSRAAEAAIGDAQSTGLAIGSFFKGMFTGPEAAKQSATLEEKPSTRIEPRLAGAMQKGSAEAYSAVVNAMARGKDPNVKATEKQTGVLVKAITANKVKFTMVGAFA